MANFMPKRLSDFMVAALTFFVSHILKFRKNIIVSNLKNAFASSKSSIEISKLVEANYRHYAEVFFDVICGLNWTRDETIMKTDCQGEENLRGSETQKSGGFILASHLGNWELSIQIAASRGHKLCVVVKKPQTSWGEILLQKFRTRYGIKVIYETGITKDIFGALADGYW